MSGLFSSKTKSSSTSKTEVPQNYQNFLNQSLQKASEASSTPFVQYQGQRIADLSGNEQMGIQGAAQNYGMYQPLVDMATMSSADLATKAGRAPTSGEMGQFINPYVDYVLGNSLDRLQEQSDINMTKIGSQAGMSGAFGGLRHGVLEGANLAELLKSARDLSGTTYADAYDKGMGNWWKSQDSQRASIDTLLGTARGGQAYNQGDISQLMQTGLTERTRNQGLLDFNFGEFMREQEDPLTKASFMSSIAAQYPRDIFTKTTKSESTTTDSPIKTLAGIGLAAAGIMSGNPAAALSMGAGSKALPTSPAFNTGSGISWGAPSTSVNMGGGNFSDPFWKFNKGGQVKGYAEGGFLDDIKAWGANRDMDMVKAGLSIAGGGDPLEALDAYEQNQRYIQGYAKGGKVKSPAWQRKEGKNPEGGLNAKGRAAYNRQTGGNLKAPQPEGGSRRDSFCARMGGMKKKLTSSKTANDPDSRINKALRKWKCADGGLIQGYAGGGRIGPGNPKGLNIPTPDESDRALEYFLRSFEPSPATGFESNMDEATYLRREMERDRVEKEQRRLARYNEQGRRNKALRQDLSNPLGSKGNPLESVIRSLEMDMPEEPYSFGADEGTDIPPAPIDDRAMYEYMQQLEISKALGKPGKTLRLEKKMPKVFLDESTFQPLLRKDPGRNLSKPEPAARAYQRSPDDAEREQRKRQLEEFIEQNKKSPNLDFLSNSKRKYAEGGMIDGDPIGKFRAMLRSRGNRRNPQQEPVATTMPVQQPFSWDRFNQARAMNGQLSNLTGHMLPNTAMGQRPDLSGYMTAMQNRMQPPQQAFAGGGYVKKKEEPKSLKDLADVLAGRKMQQLATEKKETPKSLKDLKDSLAKEQVKEQPWLDKLQDMTWGRNHMERVRKNNTYQEGGDVFIKGGRSFEKSQDRVPAEMVDPLAALYHGMDTSAGKFRPDFQNLGREDVLSSVTGNPNYGEGTITKAQARNQNKVPRFDTMGEVIDSLPVDPNTEERSFASTPMPAYTKSRMWDDVNEDVFIEGTKRNEQDNRSSVKNKNLSKNDADMTLKGTHAFTQFQYTEDTWNSIVEKIPKDIREKLDIRPVYKKDIYKYKSGDEELAKFLPTPEAAAYVYRNYYLPTSYSKLKSAGLPITEMNLYLAHHLGPDGAVSAIPALYSEPDRPMKEILKEVGLTGAASSKGNPWTRKPSLTFAEYRKDKESAYEPYKAQFRGETIDEIMARDADKYGPPLDPDDRSLGGRTIDGGITTFNPVKVISGGRGFAEGGQIKRFDKGGYTTPNNVTVVDPLSVVTTVPTKPKRQRSDNVLRMPANKADWKAGEPHWSDRLHEVLFTPASDAWGDINDFIATTGNFGYTIGESNRGKVPTEYPIIMPIKQRSPVEQREPTVPKGAFSGPNFFDSASDDVAAYYDSLGSMVDADPLNAALAEGEPSAPMADAVGSGIASDTRTFAQDEDEVMLKQMMRERIKAMQEDKGPQQPTLFGLNVNMDLVKLGLGMLASDKNFAGALGESGMNLIQSKEQEALRKSKENSQKLQELLDLRYKNAMMESMDPEVKAELARQKAASDMQLDRLKHKNKLEQLGIESSSNLARSIALDNIKRIQDKIALGEQPLTEAEKSTLWAHGIEYQEPIKPGSWFDLD